MITAQTIQTVKDFAYVQTEKYGVPSLFHLEYANEKGQWLADKLNANKNIVLLGTSLMDCMIGVAMKESKLSEHAEMSVVKAQEILSALPEIEKKEIENIVACIRQHHGVGKFFSLEAEVCCNADCYRFASVKGALGGMVLGRRMKLDDLVDLYSKKADEKWNALSLDVCKKELEPEYKILKQLFASYRFV